MEVPEFSPDSARSTSVHALCTIVQLRALLEYCTSQVPGTVAGMATPTV